MVIGETVTIDCATNEKNVNLNLLQLKKGTDQPIILQVRNFYRTNSSRFGVRNKDEKLHSNLKDNENDRK